MRNKHIDGTYLQVGRGKLFEMKSGGKNLQRFPIAVYVSVRVLDGRSKKLGLLARAKVDFGLRF